jgi:glycosyltransferase
MKVSIITTCYNREKTIAQAIESVLGQDYPHIEYIVVDGMSQDRSLEVIRSYGSRITKVIAEPDGGMYEAINKGIKAATGEVIGLLHSDDFLMHNHIIAEIVEHFQKTSADMVYGDGLFVDADETEKVIRDWRSGNYHRWKVRLGWLPLHPTVYIKRSAIEQYGLYDESYKIAADSDFLVRYLWKADLKVEYLKKYVLRMRMGGLSTDSQRRKAMWKEDVDLFRANGFWGVPEKILKMGWKVPQFVKAKLKRHFDGK